MKGSRMCTLSRTRSQLHMTSFSCRAEPGAELLCASVALASRNAKAATAIKLENRGAVQLGKSACSVWVVGLIRDHTCHTFIHHRARLRKAKPNQQETGPAGAGKF